MRDFFFACLTPLLCFFACATASAADSAKGATPIQVVRTWQDLLNQPAIPAGTGKARLGVEARTAPCMSGIFLYCLTEGYSMPQQWKENNRLGPFQIVVRHEGDEKQQAAAISYLASSDAPDIRHSTALFRRSIPLDRPGTFHVQVMSEKREVIAETEVTATRERYHCWMPFERTAAGTPERRRDEFDAVDRVKAGERGIAIPRFDGMAPMLFRSDGPEIKVRRQADERLPALLPETTGDGLTVKATGTRLIVTSKENIILARPDWHFLVRWWVNDKPYIPVQTDPQDDQNGKVIIGKKLLLHLDFDPRRIGARPGDEIEVQLLYCKNGWQLVSPGTEMLSAQVDAKGPDLLLSNRTRLAWKTARKD